MVIELTGTRILIYFCDNSAHCDTSLGFMLRLAPVEVTVLILGFGDDLVAHEWHLKLVADEVTHTARGTADL